MNPDEVVAIIEELACTWNARELERFLDLLSEDVEWDDPAMSAPARGKAAVRSFSVALIEAFPDFHYEIRPPICVSQDSTRAAVTWHITGTHLHPLSPPGYGPTNRTVYVEGVDIIDFAGYKVSRISTFFDVRVPAGQLLGLSFRPQPGSARERVLVVVQRICAAWLRVFGKHTTA
jgi:steroid delta-isomerase-like uncharacterized protein